MFIPKKYGQSKIDKCPFCQKQATIKNKQGLPVCTDHKQELLDGLKCLCGSNLEMLSGKFGIFFSCFKCGNINLRKALEINDVKPRVKQENTENTYSGLGRKETTGRKEITIRSDDPRYFD